LADDLMLQAVQARDGSRKFNPETNKSFRLRRKAPKPQQF
jgi:hypothetical protein